MEFIVSCECGRSIAVSASSAGLDLKCQCGRMVSVPSLAALRRRAGLPPVDLGPDFRIDQMLHSGELPPAECIVCGHQDCNLTPFFADCERQYVKRKSGFAVGVGIGPLFVPIASREGSVECHGRDLIVPLPVKVCEHCHRTIPRPTTARGVGISAAVGIGLSILCMFVVHWSVAIAFLIISAALFIASKILPRTRQKALRQMLKKVPVYAELLETYPDATIMRATITPD